MKRRWTLIAVFAALAVLIGGYFLLRSRPAAPKSKAPESAQIQLAKLDKDKIARIVLKSGQSLVLQKKGKDWKLDSPSPIPLSSGNVDTLVSTFTDLSAKSIIERNPTNLAQYGLKPPHATAEATLDDGSSKTFYLGDKTPAGNSYYLMVKGDPKVYSVMTYVGDYFQWKAADIRNKDIFPSINSDEITYLRLSRRDGTVIELKEKTAAESKDMALGFSNYIMTRPYPEVMGVDSDKVSPLLKGPADISISGFVDDNPESLSRYGLDRPVYSLLVRDKANTLALDFGSSAGSDKTYFKAAGKPNVYSVDTSLLSFMDAKPFDLIAKFVYLPMIDTVDRIEITAGGKTHILALSRTVKKAQKQGEEDEKTVTYTADGKQVDEGAFKGFYQALIGLSVEGEAKRKVQGGAEMTTRFILNTGDMRQTLVTYVPYDRDFDAVFVNGRSTFVISKAQLQLMLNALDKLLSGAKTG